MRLFDVPDGSAVTLACGCIVKVFDKMIPEWGESPWVWIHRQSQCHNCGRLKLSGWVSGQLELDMFAHALQESFGDSSAAT